MKKFKQERIKKLTLTTLLAVSTVIHASDLMELSESYTSKYVHHMGEHIGDAQEVKDLEGEVSQVSSQLSRLQGQKQDLESELHSAHSKKSEYQSELESLEKEISNTQMRIQFLLEEFYPRYSNAAELSQGVNTERARLESKVELVRQEIADRSAPFLQRIEMIEAQNSDKRDLLSRTISDKKSNQSRLNSSVKEKEKLENKIAALKRQMANTAKLDADVAAAEAKYKKAKDRKGDRKCILGSLFSSKCRDYFKAKDALNEIKDIKSGKTLASKEKELNQEKTKIIGYKQKIEKAATRERQLNADIIANQNDIQAQETRMARVTSSLRPLLIENRSELAAFESGLSNANRIFSYQDDVNSLRSRQNHAESAIEQINQRIPALPQEIAQMQRSIDAKASELNAVQAELTGAEDQIQKDKKELLLTESELKIALIEANEVDVNIDLPFFAENEVYSNRDWNFSMAEGSVFDQGSTTCVASTKGESKEGSVGALSVGKVLSSHEASEPTVFIKVKTDKVDELTTKAKSITVTSPSSSREFKLNLVPSLSTSDELTFVVEIAERADLIATILAEYSLKASLNHGEDTFIFSLMGSTKVIKSSDSSLSAQCEGIEIID